MSLLQRPKCLVLAAAVAAIWLAASPAFADELGAAVQRIQRLEHQVSDVAARAKRVDMAQLFSRPAEDIPDADMPADGSRAAPAQEDPDAAALTLRIDRLESQMRTLTGQIEQNQFAIRQLGDQFRKFQQDVDGRFGDGAARAGPRIPPKRAESDDALPNDAAAPPSAVASAAPPPRRRGDAFDPQSDPDAPGAPRVLGAVPAPSVTASLPSGPVIRDPDAPLDLTKGVAVPSAPAAGPSAGSLPGPSAIGPGGAVVAARTPGAGPREDFDGALALMKQGQYEPAQLGFEGFVQKYPKDRLVPDAVYYLGESYAQRGRQREAAEQFLKLATDYAKSSRAPEGLVRLGMSLNALGAKDQACATFGEVNRKYPNASVAVKSSVDRELKRAKC